MSKTSGSPSRPYRQGLSPRRDPPERRPRLGLPLRHRFGRGRCPRLAGQRRRPSRPSPRHRALFQLLADRHPPDLARAGRRLSGAASPAHRRCHRLSRADRPRHQRLPRDLQRSRLPARPDRRSLQRHSLAANPHPGHGCRDRARDSDFRADRAPSPASIVERVDPRVRQLESCRRAPPACCRAKRPPPSSP